MTDRPSANPRWTAACRVAGGLAGCGGLALAWMLLLAWPVARDAHAAVSSGVYTCIDANGRRHTSDRPIPECLDREQRLLNHDGSEKRILPPRMNAEEQAAAEERERIKARARAAAKDAVRRDRNLMLRYPNQAKHNQAREAALDDVRRGIELSNRQLMLLETERKPLLAETEFYQGRRLPQRLRSKLEANEAQQQAQNDIIRNQEAEMARVNALYDAELARLKRLWAGEAPGSVSAVAAPGSPR